MFRTTNIIEVSTPVFALTRAPNVPTPRNGLTPVVLSTVRVRALVFVLKQLEQTVIVIMFSYIY